MEKYILLILCRYGSDVDTQVKCQQVLKQTVRQFQIYQTIKEREEEYRLLAEDTLTKPGFWVATTVISTASSQKLMLTGHNVMGIDSVNLRLGQQSELSLTWSF